MGEEAVFVRSASALSKLRVGYSTGGAFESPRSSSFSGKGVVVAHHRRGSSGSSHELLKHGKSKELVSEGKEGIPSRKPVVENGGGIGVEAVVRKTVVVKPKPMGDRKIESPEILKGKRGIATESEHVNEHTEQSASEITVSVTRDSNIAEGTETSFNEEMAKEAIQVASEIEKVIAEKTSPDAKDLDLFKKSFTVSKEKPSLLKLPSLIGRTTDGRNSVEGRKSVDGKNVLRGSKSFDGKKLVEGRKSLDGRKLSDVSVSVNSELTRKGDGSDSNVVNKNEGMRLSPAKRGVERSRSLNLKTNVKESSLLNAENNEKLAAPKPKILGMRPVKSLSLFSPSSDSLSKTGNDGVASKKISTLKPDASKVSKPTVISPSSGPSANGDERKDTKKDRVVRLISSLRRSSQMNKVAAKDPNEQGIKEDTLDVVKQAPEKKSLESTNIKVTSRKSLLSPAPSVSKSTVRSRIPYLPTRNKNSVENSEQKITKKDASPSGARNGMPTDIESDNKRPSKLKARSTSLVAETTPKRSYLKKDGPARNVHKNSSDKFLPGYSNIRRKKTIQVLSNKVIEETANRLIRTRKSKVLALIGAFETVISNQKRSSAQATLKIKKKIPASDISP